MKDKIFAVELAFDTAPRSVCKHASEKTQDLWGLHKKLEKNASPYFIINTCRRITVFTASSCPGKTIHFFKDLGIEKKYLQVFKSNDAVQHLLEIAGGLKSANVGENEILYQLKNVLKESSHLKTVDVSLRKLLQKAIETGRRIRSETAILKNNLSYPALVQKVLNEQKIHIAGAKILIVGNGKLGNSCIKYFLNKEANITLATRNPGKAAKRDPDINIISRAKIVYELGNFQIVIGAATANKPVILRSDVEKLTNSPIFIDLAMPANFDPEINVLSQNLLFNLDYIFETANTIKEEKSIALNDASRIIDEEKNSYIHWLKGRKAVKIISTLKEELEQIKSEEHNRLIDDLGEMDLHQKKIVNNLVNRLASRIAHTHYSHIKSFVINEQS